MPQSNQLPKAQEPESIRTIDVDSYEHLRDKIAGVLLGSAVADALGWPTEFVKTPTQLERTLRRQQVTDFIPWEKRTGGRFNTYIDYIQPGEYSDDTQLTLCVARCIKPDGSFDPESFAKKELPYWLAYARGAGGTITRAAQAITRRGATWDNNFFSYDSRGKGSDYTQAGANGAAMRIAPHALANIYDERQALQGVWQDTIVTHGHPRALWGALLYCKVLLTLLSWESGELLSFLDTLSAFVSSVRLEEISGAMRHWANRWEKQANVSFDDTFAKTRVEVNDFLNIVGSARTRPLSETYKLLGCLNPGTKGSGTATVVAALAIFLKHGGNYREAVLKAVNMLGSDTDTIGAMVGGMAAAFKGQLPIPDEWANKMQDYGYFVRVAEALTRIALRQAVGSDLAVDHMREQFENRQIVDLAKNRMVHKGQRVTHSILGSGWVTEAHSQQIRRRGGGTMLLARVVFDMGQSCVFRSYLPPEKSAHRDDGKRVSTQRRFLS